ncbi:hypothetical protein K470DRAFT_260157 [Piedraia hortae CBS 480.64]|uniref:FAD-binding FR-type domain-containing protein n=1 Tax=Piedraia hortae CBS 480.64 TaxID=1314780 RepID=A0A6A7BS20_9PEZI|nr:hypothetical protein K470DRAFT_260157 [Piedraia hortae CBS 480.64]
MPLGPSSSGISHHISAPTTPRFGVRHHKHKHIPTCLTSHPDNPIPAEPQNIPMLRVTPQLRAQFSTMPSNVFPSATSVPESLETDGTTDSSNPSSTPVTPGSEPGDVTDISKQMADMSVTEMPRRTRRASKTFVSNTDDMRRLLGNGPDKHAALRYCCGDGCCMVEALPALPGSPENVFVRQPDNAAYKFLGINVGSLCLDSPITNVVPLPKPTASFGPIRRESIAAKFEAEETHSHDRETVNKIPPLYMKPHPPYDVFNAPVYSVRELTKPGAVKRTFHFDIDVTDYPVEGGVDFKVGGAIGVCPPNDPAVVDDILNQLCIPNFQRDKLVRLNTTSGRWPTIWGDEQARELVTTRREVLTWTLDISSTPPTKPLLRVLAEYADEPNEKKILMFLASAQGQAAFCDLRTGPHITLQQLLHAFPSSKPPLEALCGVLKQLMPRFYSLSNDPRISSDRAESMGRRLIEVAVTIHDTPAYTGTNRAGVGSGFLERIAKEFIAAEEQAGEADGGPGEAGRRLKLSIPMFRGLMSNPLSREFASDGPMILVGAGVGMAPFRGFILNRLKNANCANKIWLIQGIRDSMLDEIYRGELGAHEKEIKKVVQSRASRPPPVSVEDDEVSDNADDDQPAKLHGRAKKDKVAKYVQDEVRLQADAVWYVINAVDGRVFVCGSSKGMGEGVESALIDVAMDKGGLDYETAKQFWQGKKESGQYIAETW